MTTEFSAKTYPHHSALHPTVDLPRKMQRRYRMYSVFVAVLLGAVSSLLHNQRGRFTFAVNFTWIYFSGHTVGRNHAQLRINIAQGGKVFSHVQPVTPFTF